MQISGRMTPDEFWRHVDETDERVRLAAASMRLFGLKHWDGPIMVGDWQWENQQLETAGLAHGMPDDDVSVHVVAVRGDPRRQALRAMSSAIGLHPGDTGYKEKRRSVRESNGATVTLPIDGVGVEFEMWGGPSRWWAAGRVDGVGVVIESRNFTIGQTDLVEAHDVGPYLLGRRAYLQAARGEIG